jgi:6-phosphofructokinase
MKLAVLTSGGDSAGMNAAVRAVVKAGIIKCASCPYLSYLATLLARSSLFRAY